MEVLEVRFGVLNDRIKKIDANFISTSFIIRHRFYGNTLQHRIVLEPNFIYSKI